MLARRARLAALLVPWAALGCNRGAQSTAGPIAMEGGDAARTQAHAASGVPTFGRIVWTRGPRDGETFSGGPVVLDGVVYAIAGVGPTQAALLAIDARTGAVRWRFPMEGGLDRGTPAATRHLVYVATSNGTLQAVRADTGTLAWTHKIPTPPDLGRIAGYPVFGGPSPPLVIPEPRLAGKLVYLGGWSGYSGQRSPRAFAIDADTGRPRWSETGGAGAIAGDTLFVRMEAGVLLAVDALSGKEKWTFREAHDQEAARTRSYAASAESTGTVVSEGTVHFGHREGLYAVDARSGRLRWRAPHHLGGATPAVSGGRLYFRSEGHLYALEASTGAAAWVSTACAEAHSNVWPSPAVAGGMLYIPTVKRLCVADAATGAERWTFDPSTSNPPGGSVFWTTPAIGEGALFVVSRHHLYAIDGVPGSDPPVAMGGDPYPPAQPARTAPPRASPRAVPSPDIPQPPGPARAPTPEERAAEEAHEQRWARDQRRPLIHVSSEGVLFAATTDGIARSRDDGRTWESANQGLEARATIALASSPTGATFALTEHGLFVSENGAAGWTAIGSSPDGRNWDTQNAARRLFVDRAGRLILDWTGLPWVSEDRGRTWQKLPMPMMERLRHVQALAITPEGDVVIAHLGNLLRSTPEGRWTSLAGPDVAMGVRTIWPLREGRFLLEGRATAVRAADGRIADVTWPAPTTARRMIQSVVDAGSTESYALASEYAKAGESPALRLFRLQGTTFTALPALPVCSSADTGARAGFGGLGRTRAGDLLFASTRCVFRSRDRGATWTRVRGP